VDFAFGMIQWINVSSCSMRNLEMGYTSRFLETGQLGTQEIVKFLKKVKMFKLRLLGCALCRRLKCIYSNFETDSIPFLLLLSFSSLDFHI
jgi:hypothetical protein